ncbi:unnamed protein product [Chondrus crispus]|uniref:Uncharacterized protein n=1 Tax=Chondrus crispus TaxID=2769 RepID=R7QRL5_CHOCR|nr:unnamed protein product [Chondrus crispus]CDF40136.1 unnamed protein product [Chondrus crispus]|eukprot:XP_005710430.1 unnamed protein product [Chondrus crispus]
MKKSLRHACIASSNPL